MIIADTNTLIKIVIKVCLPDNNMGDKYVIRMSICMCCYGCKRYWLAIGVYRVE